jgi:hypothetical protein
MGSFATRITYTFSLIIPMAQSSAMPSVENFNSLSSILCDVQILFNTPFRGEDGRVSIGEVVITLTCFWFSRFRILFFTRNFFWEDFVVYLTKIEFRLTFLVTRGTLLDFNNRLFNGDRKRGGSTWSTYHLPCIKTRIGQYRASDYPCFRCIGI